MELRSATARREVAEYKELQITLNGMGCYENGMELHEMRQLIDALQASMGLPAANSVGGSGGATEAVDAAALAHDRDFGARKESELDFMSTHEMHNSTMIYANAGSNNNNNDSSCTEADGVQLTTQAEVHHELDWCPSTLLTDTEAAAALDLRKRRSSDVIAPNIDAADNKRARFERTPTSDIGTTLSDRSWADEAEGQETELTDSGISSCGNYSNIATYNTTTETSGIFPLNSTESSGIDVLLTDEAEEGDVDYDASENYEGSL